MSQLADGVIIGSAIVQQIANYQQQAPHHLQNMPKKSAKQ